MPQEQRNKIGRNAACPCGSGNKYKRCHGVNQKNFPIQIDFINKKIEEHNTLEVQRKLQQGLGNPIVSTEHQGYRIVAVGHRVFSGKWKTFHDFLCDYIKNVIGANWGNKELKKIYEERHPIIKLYDMVCRYQKSTIKTPGEVHSAPFIGAVSTYMWLSYNLYLIFHNSANAKLQAKLVERLRQLDQFAGANYETYIAAIFIKAGFDLEFENEADSTTTHCEFTATHKESKIKFSVEAKLRTRKNLISPKQGSESFKLGIESLLHKALKKKALYPRIVFIDLNLPTTEIRKYTPDDLSNVLNKCEQNLLDGEPLPPAYIFLTNYPYHYEIDVAEHQPLYFTKGFKIPDFGHRWTNLHDAIQSRKMHKPVYDLWSSIKAHTTIPSTFDGTIPMFTFGNDNERLAIGHKYNVSDQFGNELTIELRDAVVDKINQKGTALCSSNDGQNYFISFKMSEEEIDAYRQSPDTFFGVYREQAKGIHTPLDMFDFFVKGFKSLPKEELLNRLKSHPDYESLKLKEQQELLEIYCEGLTYNVYSEK